MISVRPFRFRTHNQIHLTRLLFGLSQYTVPIIAELLNHFFCADGSHSIPLIAYKNTLETHYSAPWFSQLNFLQPLRESEQ